LVEKVNNLIDDAQLRKQMGAAGRNEAMRWNWRSATSVLRNIQYTLAERRFRERQRWTDRRMKWDNWFRFFRRPNADDVMVVGNSTLA